MTQAAGPSDSVMTSQVVYCATSCGRDQCSMLCRHCHESTAKVSATDRRLGACPTVGFHCKFTDLKMPCSICFYASVFFFGSVHSKLFPVMLPSRCRICSGPPMLNRAGRPGGPGSRWLRAAPSQPASELECRAGLIIGAAAADVLLLVASEARARI